VRPRLLLLSLASLLLVAPTRCLFYGPAVFVLSAPESVATWERFETWGAVQAPGANPFDPAQVQLTGEFEAPDGTAFEMPGFATRDYERELIGGFEHLRARSGVYWSVRFTPDRPGVWRWRWVATVAGETSASEWRSFTATAPAPDRHGFLRVSPDDPRYLRFDDGAPYFAIGENLGWYDGRGSYAYDAWLDRLAAEGVTYIRLWMPSWAFGIEWGGLGDYGNRLDRAWQLDTVLEAAAARGIYVMLCIQNHGPFSLSANSQWADNPYNAANGGPLSDPRDFFTDPVSRALFKRRLRYVVARWGYSPNILAWELWNEVDLVANSASAEVMDWHAEMAQELDDLDPYDHLITTSTSNPTPTGLWGVPALDFTQTHFYAWPFYLDFPSALPGLLDRTRVAGKPTLLGEFGTDFRGSGETLAGDPESIGFHDGVWTGLFSLTFGTGMTWWWDNIVDPEDLYSHFGAVATLVEGIAFDREGFVRSEPEATAAGRNLEGFALVGASVVLGWIKNADHQWYPDGVSGDPSPVVGATLHLTAVPEGAWLARWIDTTTGAELAREQVSVAGGEVVLDAPDFVGDVAVRLDPAAS
jgi:hypothetical protein